MAIDYGSIIDGAARTDNILAAGVPVDMEAQTAKLDPNSYVFEALTRQIADVKETMQMKHEYREKRIVPASTVISAAVAAGDAAITVSDYTRIKNDYLLYIPSTGEMLLVQDAAIDATVSVVRLSGSGTIQSAIAVGAKVIILGESHAEGEEVPAGFSNEPIAKFNYVMQKDRRVEATDIEEAIEHYDSEEKLDADRKQAFIEYKRDQNLLFYVGQGSREIVSASGPRRHCCSGLFERITENVFDLGGAGPGLTLTTVTNILGSTKFHGASSERKVSLWGTNGMMAISAWPQASLRVSPLDKKWGIRINTVITGFGDLDIAHDPTLNAEYGLADRGVIFDTAHVRQLRLRGMPVKMHLKVPNLSTLHKSVDAITGTFGIQLKFEELHAQVYGIH